MAETQQEKSLPLADFLIPLDQTLAERGFDRGEQDDERVSGKLAANGGQFLPVVQRFLTLRAEEIEPFLSRIQTLSRLFDAEGVSATDDAFAVATRWDNDFHCRVELRPDRLVSRKRPGDLFGRFFRVLLQETLSEHPVDPIRHMALSSMAVRLDRSGLPPRRAGRVCADYSERFSDYRPIEEACPGLKVIRPLHAWSKQRRGKFLRRLKGHGAFLNPNVFLVEWQGRKMKWMVSTPEACHRIGQYRLNHALVRDAVPIPDIVYADDRQIVSEFVEGDPVDPRENRFARALGEFLARLHGCQAGSLTPSQWDCSLRLSLDYLTANRMITVDAGAEILAAAKAAAPEIIPTGTIYGDMKAANFCYGKDGALVPFDFGSFAVGAPLDSAWATHGIRARLEVPLVEEGYRAAGGNLENLGQHRYLEIAARAGNAAYFHWSTRGTHQVELMWHYNRLLLVADCLRKLGDAAGVADLAFDAAGGLSVAAKFSHRLLRSIAAAKGRFR